ncbi:MAG: 6-bladed beta-propeller [Phycisphaerae bacterium]
MTRTRYCGPALWVTAAVVLALASAGCETKDPSREVLRTWPEPPAPAHILLRQVITGSKDVDRPNFLERLASIAAGARNQTLLRPQDVAVDGDRVVYVADQEHQGIHVFDLEAGDTRFLDRAGDLYFVSPAGVAMVDGLLAVSDSALGRVFLLTPEGDLEKTLDRPGGFERPTGLAWDAQRRRLYVVDTLANQVWLFNRRGEAIRAFGRPGTGEGQFNYPTYISLDATGRIFVTDSLNFRIQIFDRHTRFLRAIGELGDATGYMAVPKGVAVDSFGHVYVVDSYLATVQIFDAEGRFLLAFGARGEGAGDFQVPTGLTVGEGDRIYVCDGYNRTLQVFEYVGRSGDATGAS